MFQDPSDRVSVYHDTPFAYSAYSFHVPWICQVIFALRMAAGPGAGTPPPEVVGAALHQAKATPWAGRRSKRLVSSLPLFFWELTILVSLSQE